jgi:hypothetical protein
VEEEGMIVGGRGRGLRVSGCPERGFELEAICSKMSDEMFDFKLTA